MVSIPYTLPALAMYYICRIRFHLCLVMKRGRGPLAFETSEEGSKEEKYIKSKKHKKERKPKRKDKAKSQRKEDMTSGLEQMIK